MHLVPDIIRQLLQIVIINIIFSFGKGSGCFDCTVLSAEISNITLAFIQRLVSVEGSHNIHKIHDRHGGIPIFAHKDGVLRVVIENAYGFCFLTYQKFELCNRRKCRRDGIFFTFLYNFFAAALRSVGNSFASLLFLLLSTAVNIALDLLFVLVLRRGVAGAALATVIAQGLSAAGIALYFFFRLSELRPRRSNFRLDRPLLSRIASVSVLTSVQQSIMNFGILLVQSLVNSFGVTTMAAFAAGVKIDSFAYSPAQDFANGFATFVAQNTGAGKPERVKQGIREAALLSLSFCAVVSALVFIFARPLLTLFINPGEREILAVGVHYLRVEGVFYVGIGLLFLLYAIYRGLERAGMSVVLTVISLGLRVALAYAFAPRLGVTAIWLAIPIGWFIADAVGLIRLKAALPH